MILVSHPTGNANVRAVVRAFAGAHILDSFCTSLGASEGDPKKWRTRILRRRIYSLSRERLKLHPRREVVRIIASKLGLTALIRHEVGWACIDSVYREIDQAVGARLRNDGKRISGVYCYEDGALDTFRAAFERRLRRFYDLPIAYWETTQRLLREEAERLPAWEPTLGGTRDSSSKLERKTQEMELAEVVICPSQFVVDSIPRNLKAGKKIVIAPFGSPSPSAAKDSRAIRGGKLRVLFVGSMTQRKGLADLLAAMRLVKSKDVELVILGSPQAPMEFYRREFSGFRFESGRPHGEVLELMRSCDIFCLPSIVEGRALVMQEAMSQGLPLIITANTGGEDLIDEGVNGFLVPIRQPQKIADKISWFLDHRNAIPQMSRAAQVKSALLTWESYGQSIINTVLAANYH